MEHIVSCHISRHKSHYLSASASERQQLIFVWIRFGGSWECENKRKVVFISQLVISYELLQNKTVQPQVFCVMNYKCVEVAFDKINKDAERGKIMNISIAAFTTCWEWLRLYHHLDTANLNALYSETDSVVYKWWLGQPEIPLGNFLGEVTDELVSGGRMRDHIVNSSPVVLKTVGTGPRGERWV